MSNSQAPGGDGKTNWSTLGIVDTVVGALTRSLEQAGAR